MRVSVEFYGARKPYVKAYIPNDIGNAWASLKAAIDGLVDAKVIPDDSHKWLTYGECKLFRTAKEHGGKSCVRLLIEVQD